MYTEGEKDTIAANTNARWSSISCTMNLGQVRRVLGEKGLGSD